jgi:hypothetical protein
MVAKRRKEAICAPRKFINASWFLNKNLKDKRIKQIATAADTKRSISAIRNRSRHGVQIKKSCSESISCRG